jgi:PAS domain S-box-containing protein
VDKFCMTQYPGVYAVGDISGFKGDNEIPFPAMVENAIQTAHGAAINIINEIRQEEKKEVEVKMHGVMVSVGNYFAVSEIMGKSLPRWLSIIMKFIVNIHYLWEITGFYGIAKYLYHEILQRKQNKNIIEKQGNDIEKLQKTEFKTELEKKIKELDSKNDELLKHQEIINCLKQEKNDILLSFDKIKNTIPSSIIIVDKNNNITNLNKKAEELLGVNIDKSLGTNLFEISQMKKERISNGILQSEREKKPLSIQSVSIKNNKGDIRLTNISHIPMIGSKGDLQGAIMILDDVTDTEEIKADLKIKEEDLGRLDSKLKNANNKLQISNKGKIAFDEHFSKLKEEKQKEKIFSSN